MESAAALDIIKAIQIPINLLAMLNSDIWPPKINVENNTCFDYIVVGGGTAGCVLGNRLTEDGNHTVLLLEAGDNPTVESALPPLFVLEPGSPRDWNFTSVYDPYAASAQNNFTKLTAGRVLGGSSSINHFISYRGNPADYNDWAKYLNDSSWSYESLLPYFKKKETLNDPEILNSEFVRYHGLSGPIGIARQPHPEAKPFLKAFNETGNPIVLDLNGNITLGYTQSLFTVSDGVRQSTAFSYLKPIKNRKNLYVLRNTMATKIIFEGKRAVAVVAVRNGKTYVYRASKEIIVCAGVIKSPQLLMISGIGPRNHLESLKIKVVADLPVGYNYQDQVATAIVYRTTLSKLLPPPETFIPTEIPFPVILGSKALNPNQSRSDYQDFALIISHETPFLILACAVVFQLRPEICDKFNNKKVLRDILFTVVTLPKPGSKGNVRLNSTSIFDDPLINTGFYTNATDLDKMVEYIMDFITIGNSTYFKKIGAELIDPGLVQCKNYTFQTKDYWRCYALNTAFSPYHPTSTCPMGTVVDSKLKVYNVTNLRVVDASVMPNETSGSPHEAVLMIAEKASDMIKADSDKEPKCNELYGTIVKGDRDCSTEN